MQEENSAHAPLELFITHGEHLKSSALTVWTQSAAKATQQRRWQGKTPSMAPKARVISSGFAITDGSIMQQQGGEAPPLQAPPPPMDEADDSRKSERKRQRERQRRSDLASAFDELSTLLTQIETPSGELAGGGSEDSSARRRRRRSGTGDDMEDSAGMTRLDLIGRTVGVLRRLLHENADLRRRLMEGGGGGDGDEKVRTG